MISIINERQVTEEQQEMLELEQQAPEKFDPEFEFMLNKHASDRQPKTSKYQTLTPEETRRLLEASFGERKTVEEPRVVKDYEPLDRETAARLVREHYEYKEREKKRKEQQWALEKTIESVKKTVPTTKRSKSLKD